MSLLYIKPLVSICMSSYNNAQFVVQTLDSIASQTYENIELIIIDDCSKDNSVDLIDKWLKTYHKPYTFVKNEVNKGICKVANLMLENSNGDYMSIIASDDLMLPEKTSEQVDFIKQFNGKAALVYGDCMMIDEHGNTIRESMFSYTQGNNFIVPSGNIFSDIVSNFLFYLQASLIDLNLLKSINFVFDNNIISEDWDIQLALGRNFEIHGCDRVYVKYRFLTTSVTAVNWTDQKKHLVEKSHFLMFYKYLDHSLNSVRDKFVLLNKLRSVYWEYFSSKNSSYKYKVLLFYKIVKKTNSVNDFMTLVKIISKLK